MLRNTNLLNRRTLIRPYAASIPLDTSAALVGDARRILPIAL